MIYGTINSLLHIAGTVKPDVVHVVWDPKGGSTFRKNLYGLYKANRDKMDDAFYDEMNLLKQLLHALAVIQICKDGVEADDVLGYLATVLYKDHEVFVASNDADMLQLMSNRVKIVHPEKGIIELDSFGRVCIKEQSKSIYLRPDQVPDYKALVGDTSDNYPGLIGFGIGAAINYFGLNEYVEPIMDNTADLRNQRSQALNAILTCRGMIPLFKKLATINVDEGLVEVPIKPERNEELVSGLLDHLEFNQFKALGPILYGIGGK
jgi:DNA polymerase-1